MDTSNNSIFVIFDVFPSIFPYFVKLLVVGRGPSPFVYKRQGMILITAVSSYLSTYGAYKAIVIGIGVVIDVY